MKRNLDTPLLDLNNQPYQDGSTLKTACVAALSMLSDKDQHATLEYKLSLYDLAKRIHAGGEVDLTAEEIALLKQRISATFNSAIVIGYACALLEA